MQKDNIMSAWSHPPAALSLEPQHVDIWRARLEFPNESLKMWEATLSTDEAERAARFHFPADRDRFVASHGFLRGILARYLHSEPGELTFSVNQYGKPALNDHKLEFNLSHSRDFALVAVAQKRKVGVDVERIRQGISSQSIARQYFSKSEVAELQILSLEQREVAFFTCWTRKEAYIKAQGLGLSLPLESFDVSLTPNEPAILRATRPDPEDAARWTLLSLDVDSHYGSAVAVEGQGLEFRLWDWNLEIHETSVD
ncbi:MAG: 4'-phosphopantetheinyl transferase superfamily protein [Anaerolineales bacterium]|nr:4'-phosphopantetheinyl transferase superfamily protein [Anaerolineales bacterium]